MYMFDFIATIAHFYSGANRNNFTENSYCYLGDYNPRQQLIVTNYNIIKCNKMSIVCISTHLQIQIQVCLTYKICNEDRPAKIPCGISSIMQFDNFLQQIKIRNLH